MVVQGKARRICAAYESTLSTADAVPLPRWGRLRGVTLRVDFYKGRCPKVVFKSRVTSHNNDMSSPLETEVPQRDFRVWPNPKRRLACPLRRLPVWPNGPRQRRRMDQRSGVKDYVRLAAFHLSSRPKWRDLCCMEAASPPF